MAGSTGRRTSCSTNSSGRFPSIGVCCRTNWRSIAPGRRAIRRAGILTAPECERTLAALDEIAGKAAAEPAWLDASPAEDVHHFVEMALVERLGPLGFKLHTARSRNELVATDFRLFVKDAARETARDTAGLAGALIEFAERAMGVPMAGHDAPAACAAAAVFAFPAGACRASFSRHRALGRSHADGRFLPAGIGRAGRLRRFRWIVRPWRASWALRAISANSLDAVGDRDFALDYLYALSTVATHLSRLAEDFVLFASTGV